MKAVITTSNCHCRCAWSEHGVLTSKPAAIGVKAPYPGFIERALASSIEKVPGGDRWIHEIKFDGYRVQVHPVNERSRSSPVAVTLGQENLRPARDLTIAGFALDGIAARSRTSSTRVHGFDKTSAAALRKRLTPLIRKTQPYAKKIGHKAIWVEPELLAEIEYRAKSAEGKVRHPFFKGLREAYDVDKRSTSGTPRSVLAGTHRPMGTYIVTVDQYGTWPYLRVGHVR
jgi:ATP-dependent DNA ligase